MWKAYVGKEQEFCDQKLSGFYASLLVVHILYYWPVTLEQV